ncbi:MAG TPA: T9SS type A sorting domain-containing protein, partial [Saprospiraceae bacterium]|nr:T9SS type A sorting domain-containing protein [Saprospiraceae bacterium]
KFFSSDSTASPWFTGTGCSTTVNTQNSEQGLFTIHPNPASGILAIKFPGPSAGSMYLYLFDLFGKQVMKQKIPGGAESAVLDISSLGEGVYFLRQDVNGSTLKAGKLLIAK